ncbi:MAG: response regulator transcription factor [Gammaproteobacteria bacterium]|nr:response regulator transcription factor [Gammaproteobacteria bacterium]
MTPIKPISVLIADDHALVRHGLQGILAHAPDVHVVGEAKDGVEAVELALGQKPDVMLMDLQMPRMNGLDATQKILHKNSNIKIIILSSLETPAHLQQAMQAGAKGYLIKNTLPQEMIKAIHTVAKGGYHFHNQAIPLCSPPASIMGVEQIAKLSLKEKEVFHLILKGYEIPAMAKMLNREVRTLRMHRENIRKKLGVENDAQLILWAAQAGYTHTP